MTQDENDFWVGDERPKSDFPIVDIERVEASGGLLFVHARISQGRRANRRIEVYQTEPEFRLEALIEAPSGEEEEFANQFAAFGDLLVATGKSDRTLRIHIFRRSVAGPAEEPVWSRIQMIEWQGFSNSFPIVDTDGSKIAIVSEDEGNRQNLQIFSESAPGVFTEEFTVLLSEPNSDEDPLVRGVAIDQNLVAVTSERSRGSLSPKGLTILFEKTAESWQRSLDLPPADRPTDPSRFFKKIDLGDGILAGIGDVLAYYDFTDRSQVRPRFTALPPTKVVDGGQDSHTIDIQGSEPFTITVEQLPLWLNLENREGTFHLAGVADGTTGESNTIRLEVTDSQGLGSYQTIFVEVLPATGVPEVGALPELTTLKRGEMFTLFPDVTGAAPLAYQWYRNGEVLEDETRRRLVRDQWDTDDAGDYQLEVSNLAGSIRSGVASVGVGPSDRSNGNWTTYAASVGRSGHVPAALGTHQFVEIWQSDPGRNRSWNRAVVVDGKVFLATATASEPSQIVQSLALADGSINWTTQFDDADRLTLHPFSYFEETLYFPVSRFLEGVGNRDQLRAIKASDGSQVWTADLTSDNIFRIGLMEAPTVTPAGIVTKASSLFERHSLNGSKQPPLIVSDVGLTATSSNHEVFSLGARELRAISSTDWETGWSLETPFSNSADKQSQTVATSDEVVFLTREQLVCVDRGSRTIRWSVGKNFYGTLAVAWGHVYAIGGVEGQIQSFDLTTGELLGTYDFPKKPSLPRNSSLPTTISFCQLWSRHLFTILSWNLPLISRGVPK